MIDAKILEQLIIGDSDYDVDFLFKHVSFSGFINDDDLKLWLQEILKDWSPEFRSRYLRFVWGKSRLPLYGVDFDHRVSKETSWGDDKLPSAGTCNFILKLPAYSSKEIMKNKLEYALLNCLEIDSDFNAQVAEM